jgi:hypothetical protein
VLANQPGANEAIGAIGSTAYSQPGQFAGALGNNFGNYTQGLTGLGNDYTNLYGQYSGGLGSVAQAQANERSNWYGANAMAEAARQGAVGNLGSAALGAYGSAANSALGAWAANQQAYNQAAANMHTANQEGLANYGASRNNALGNLGNAYAGLGGKLAGANAVANLSFGMGGGQVGGGGGFAASGPNGPVASGSYDGSGLGPSGFSINGSRGTGGGMSGIASQGFGGLNNLQNNLMAGDITGSLNQQAQAGRDQLDSQQYSSRGMPSQMLDQTLGGLLDLGKQGYGAASSGMNQYYGAMTDPRNRADFSGVLSGLNSGFHSSNANLRGLQGQMGAGYTSANNNINNLWDRSMGQTGFFQSPLQQAQQQRAADLYNRRSQATDQLSNARYDQLHGAYGTPAAVSQASDRLKFMPRY